MEPYAVIGPDDLELIKQYEKLAANFKRLLSQVFMMVVIDYEILVGRAQNYGDFSGWHIKFKDRRCWYGICFKSENFLGTRFQIQTEGTKEGFKETLKAKGFDEITWEKMSWMGREQPTKALEITDKDQQIKAFSDIACKHLAVVEAVMAQLEAGGSIPLKQI